MKLYSFRLEQRSPRGEWVPSKSGQDMLFVTMTTNDAALLNTPCKAEYRWVLSGIETIYAPGRA